SVSDALSLPVVWLDSRTLAHTWPCSFWYWPACRTSATASDFVLLKVPPVATPLRDAFHRPCSTQKASTGTVCCLPTMKSCPICRSCLPPFTTVPASTRMGRSPLFWMTSVFTCGPPPSP